VQLIDTNRGPAEWFTDSVYIDTAAATAPPGPNRSRDDPFHSGLPRRLASQDSCPQPAATWAIVQNVQIGSPQPTAPTSSDLRQIGGSVRLSEPGPGDCLVVAACGVVGPERWHRLAMAGWLIACGGPW
jgi:hypothetical protein